MTQTLTQTLTTDFQDTDCILITDAGIEALTSAAVVPDDAEDTEDAADGFTPDTADKANWVLGLIADRRAAAARIRANAELMAREQEREAEQLEWRFGPALQAFVRQELAGGKRKSVRLYNGVLGYRTKPAGVTVTDEAAALSWAVENDLDAVISTRLDKKALGDLLLSTGEAVPFARLNPADEVFFIK